MSKNPSPRRGNLLETRLPRPEPVRGRRKARLRPVNTSREPSGLLPVFWGNAGPVLVVPKAYARDYRQQASFRRRVRRTGKAEHLMSRVIDADAKSVNGNFAKPLFHFIIYIYVFCEALIFKRLRPKRREFVTKSVTKKSRNGTAGHPSASFTFASAHSTGFLRHRP